jgi:cytoskeletal protein CcmA (bactofilin family)
MKKIIACILLTAFSVTGFTQKTINDPNAQKRSVSGYHGVAVSGNIELFLTQGSEETVAISAADTKWLDKVITEVKNGILHIYLENKNKIDWSWTSKKIRAYVSIKNIDYLSSAGSGNVHTEGNLKADNLKVDISGSGNIKGDITVKELTIGLSGSADADLSGNAEKSDFHISGSGNIGTYDFTTAVCKVSISGSGNVKTTVTKELSAHISGSGNVFIKGDGMIRDYTSSGSGKFKRIK